MRLPRDISGDRLTKALKMFGYSVTRQTGSHMRLTTLERGEHHITVPIMIRCDSARWQEYSMMLRRILT